MIVASMFHFGLLDLCVFVGMPVLVSIFLACAHARRETYSPIKVVQPLFWLAMLPLISGWVVLMYRGDVPLSEMFVITLLIVLEVVVLGFPASLLAYIATFTVASRFGRDG